MYKNLLETALILAQDKPNQIALMANMASLIYNEIDQLNWVGFYLLKEDTLYLGPFNGKPATTTIPISRGVCGEACRTLKVINVSDVHQHPDHIACDENSKSELVIPLIIQGKLYGVLDIDSPVYHRFDDDLQKALESVAETLALSVDNIPFF
jgi:GAF domain-containing protein